MRKLIAVFAMALMVATAAPAVANTNPFMDVPEGHWAYDAVAMLAARGTVGGYPDGSYRGGQPITRYEMAAIVARALTEIDAEKASAQDMELLKKLVMEFKDELDALGVKVDELDKRVAAVEEQIGGWKLSGQFYFDANFAGADEDSSSYTDPDAGDNSFEKAQFRLYLEKQISETTSFYAEFRAGEGSAGGTASGLGDITEINVRDIWMQTVLPWNIGFRVGRIVIDFEGDHDLYVDNEPLFGDFRMDGFEFTKASETLAAKLMIGRNSQYDLLDAGSGNYMFYALDLSWQPTERFFIGVNGVWAVDDADAADIYGESVDFTTYSVYAGYSFTPAVSLSGVYYMQDLDKGIVDNGVEFMDAMGSIANEVGTASEDSPTAWKVALDFGQDLLKFTSLRLEYMQQDNTFVAWRDPYQFGGAQDASNAATIAQNMPWNDNSTTFIFAIAEQQWNDKWSTYIRYQNADFDTDGIDEATGYGIGVTYQMTPAVAFRLAYDYVDYGEGTANAINGDDNVFQFRTMINF